MRLIDADALKEQIDSHVTSMSVCISRDEQNGMQYMKEKCFEDVNSAPAIDAIPVVRCRDCKHLGEEDHCCTLIGAIAKPDWYCADGERRDDNAAKKRDKS